MGGRLSLAERFMAKVRNDASGCWIWTGATGTNGYGRFAASSRKVGGRWRSELVQAHRWAYEHFVGPIPDGMTLDHTCHDAACPGGPGCPHRACVNPAHLEPVTLLENIGRSNALRGEGLTTRCKRGHALTPENVYVRPSGARRCRICRRESWRRFSRTPKGRQTIRATQAAYRARQRAS